MFGLSYLFLGMDVHSRTKLERAEHWNPPSTAGRTLGRTLGVRLPRSGQGARSAAAAPGTPEQGGEPTQRGQSQRREDRQGRGERTEDTEARKKENETREERKAGGIEWRFLETWPPSPPQN